MVQRKRRQPWETGDKYDWSADELERIVSPLIPAKEKNKL
jgi:hypothetical protein